MGQASLHPLAHVLDCGGGRLDAGLGRQQLRGRGEVELEEQLVDFQPPHLQGVVGSHIKAVIQAMPVDLGNKVNSFVRIVQEMKREFPKLRLVLSGRLRQKKFKWFLVLLHG